MSKHHLRKDPICQNCGHTVEERYCSRCSQENVESRQSFGHLVRHVLEDITHYDGAFWRTLKYLLFRPAYLTKSYLGGKRSSYLPPVRLYIFVSFVAFFLPYILPEFSEHYKYPAVNKPNTEAAGVSKSENKDESFLPAKRKYKSVRELDSLQRVLPESERESGLGYLWKKTTMEMEKDESGKPEEDFVESLAHNFPKFLFMFMPLFALVIWLFHSKKKWFYFDHAILTLHYFSFMLLVLTLLNVVDTLTLNSFFFSNEDTVEDLSNYLIGGGFVWFIAYFFRMHLRMFGEKWHVSFIKSTFIFGINVFMFIILILGFIVFTAMNLH